MVGGEGDNRGSYPGGGRKLLEPRELPRRHQHGNVIHHLHVWPVDQASHCSFFKKSDFWRKVYKFEYIQHDLEDFFLKKHNGMQT